MKQKMFFNSYLGGGGTGNNDDSTLSGAGGNGTVNDAEGR